MIDEKRWSCDLLTDVFPESIRETLAIVSLVVHSELFEFCLHLFIGRCEKVDPCFLEYCFEVV